MNISYKFVECNLFLLLREKIGAGSTNLSNESVSVVQKHVNSISCKKLRWSFSHHIDLCMLYYALLSITPYISNKDRLTCRRFNDNFLVSVDVCFDNDILHNIPFHVLFYLSSFTHDVEKDIDLIYQFWTHGRLVNDTNMQYTLHFRKRNVAFDRVNDSYFFSTFDANLWYHISVEIAFHSNNYLYTLLCCSLFFLSFVNTNMNKQIVKLRK
jgi:hypothetical protein